MCKIINTYLIFQFLFFFFIFPARVESEEYIVGKSVRDTICQEIIYTTPCQDGFLEFRLDSILVPFVTGLTFQIEITEINGTVLSNIKDSVEVGDKFSLPVLNESGILKISLTNSEDSFTFLTKIVGIPQVAGEKYHCNILYSITEAACYNWFDIFLENDSICTVQSSTNINSLINNVLKKCYLEQNYPNPFNPTTTFKYALKEEANVTIKIYNILGNEVKTLVNENQPAGYQSVIWNGTDQSGNPVPSGIYICRITAGNFTKSQKMVLMK